MGESKRRRIQRVATELTVELADKGKLIEAGFVAFATLVIPKDAPDIQFSEMQLAFMAGAEHVWSSVMAMLDFGEEPTDADLHRMNLIQREIDEWRGVLSERVDPVKGSA